MTSSKTTVPHVLATPTMQKSGNRFRRYTMASGVLAVNLIACAQPTTTQTPTQQISACAPAQTQKAQQTMKLEKVRDVKHLIQQIHDNLGNDILCADPEWLELQWGVRIFGWRPKKGLQELARKMVDGKQVEPPPIEHVSLFWRYGTGSAAEKIPARTFFDVNLGRGRDLPGHSVIPLSDLEVILGAPTTDKRFGSNPPPLMPGQQPRLPPNAEGPRPNRELTWSKTHHLKVVLIAGFGSEVPSLSFIHTFD